MSEYRLCPRAVAAPFEPIVVALAAATTKTVLQLAVNSTADVRLIGWGVSFDGVSGTGIPVICQCIETAVAATVGTTLVPDTWGNVDGAASGMVGATTGFNASAEGAITGTPREFDSQHVHPQTGYGVFWPEVRIQPRVKGGLFVRIRCKAPAIVNVIPWLIWSEPAI